MVFVAHGYNHIFGGGRIAGTARPVLAPRAPMTRSADDPGDIDRSSVGAAFTRQALRRPDAIALRWDAGGEPMAMTYAELLRRARAAAAALSRQFMPGDRLAIWSANNAEWIVAQLGAALAGSVLVPLNPALTDDEAGFIVRTSGARA